MRHNYIISRNKYPVLHCKSLASLGTFFAIFGANQRINL